YRATSFLPAPLTWKAGQSGRYVIRRRQAPMLSRASERIIHVLFKHEPHTHELVRRVANAPQEVLTVNITLFDRPTRIAERFPFRASARKGDVGAERLVQLVGIADARRTKVPAGRRRERDRGFGVVNPGEIVAVDVDLGHEMRQGHDLAGDHLRRPFYPAGI